MRLSFRLLILIPASITLLSSIFIQAALNSAPQIADENLKGIALQISSAVEQIIKSDSFLSSLEGYRPEDAAYFYLSDSEGRIVFHTNSSLIGSRDERIASSGSMPNMEERKTLGTGETVYSLTMPVHARKQEFSLTVALHTYRAEKVIRRAYTGVSWLVIMNIIIWLLFISLMYMLKREQRREKELSRQRELAQLGEMSAVLAHEIRNPLSGIKGFAQLIESEPDSDSIPSYASKIVNQSLRLENLVSDLLEYSKSESDKFVKTDICRIASGCVEILSKEAEETGITFNLSCSSPLYADVNENRIVQLLLNLIRNAIQSMPDGGVITVKLSNEKGGVIISVRDQGVGISDEEMPNLFKPFWTTKARGTGIGLPLCDKIAKEHGGNITVSSRPGSGSEFTVKIKDKHGGSK